MSDEGRFSPWLEPGAEAPDAAGVVQLKTIAGLVRYPRGASAMLWYGAGDSVAALVREALAAATSADHLREDLRWRVRFMPFDEARRLCADLVERFERRFGASPALLVV